MKMSEHRARRGILTFVDQTNNNFDSQNDIQQRTEQQQQQQHRRLHHNYRVSGEQYLNIPEDTHSMASCQSLITATTPTSDNSAISHSLADSNNTYVYTFPVSASAVLVNQEQRKNPNRTSFNYEIQVKSIEQTLLPLIKQVIYERNKNILITKYNNYR